MQALVLVLLAVVSGSGWAQGFPDDDEGELVLAYTMVETNIVLPGGGPGARFSLQLWESGFAELTTTGRGLQATTRTLGALVLLEDVRQVKRDLIRLGILKLDGRLTPACTRSARPFDPPVQP